VQEFSPENIDNDVEIRVDSRSSFTEGPQEIGTQKNSDSENEDESVSEKSNLEQANDTNYYYLII